MVKSKYILDILNLLLDGDDEGLLARKQLPFITVKKFEYTIGGLFVDFSHEQEILEYKVAETNLVLGGVKIETTEFPIEADATLFFKNGIADNLEIWCYAGDYPKQDLTKYTLTQFWKNSPNKVFKTENEV